jgi:hypothetical protein
MKMQIESTTKIVTFNGLPARVWEGKTAKGVPVIVFVTRVAVDKAHDASELDAELEEHAPPSAELQSWPSRMFYP